MMVDLRYDVGLDIEADPLLELERRAINAADALDRTAQEADSVNSEIKLAKTAGRSYDDLERRQRELRQELEKGAAELGGINRQMREAGSTGGRAFRRVDQAANRTWRTTRQIERETGELERQYRETGQAGQMAFTGISRAAGGVLAGVGAAVGIGALSGMGDEAARTAQAVLNLAATTGLSTRRIQELNLAERQLGIQQGVLTDGIYEFNNRLSEGLLLDSGPAQEALELIGLEIADLQAMTAEQAFFEILFRADELDNTRDRILVLEELLGGIGQSLGRAGTIGRDGWRELNTELAQTNQLSDEALTRIDALTAAMEAEKAAVAEATAELAYHTQTIKGFLTAVGADILNDVLGKPELEVKSELEVAVDARQERINALIRQQMMAADETAGAADEVAEASGKQARSASQAQQAIDAADTTLQAILPGIECGAEAAVSVSEDAAALPYTLGTAFADAEDAARFGPHEPPEMELARLEAEQAQARQALTAEQAAAQEAAGSWGAIGERWQAAWNEGLPVVETGRLTGETLVRSVTEAAEWTDNAVQSIPGPSIPDAAQTVWTTLDSVDIGGLIGGLFGGNSTETPQNAVQAAVTEQMVNNPLPAVPSEIGQRMASTGDATQWAIPEIAMPAVDLPAMPAMDLPAVDLPPTLEPQFNDPEFTPADVDELIGGESTTINDHSITIGDVVVNDYRRGGDAIDGAQLSDTLRQSVAAVRAGD